MQLGLNGPCTLCPRRCSVDRSAQPGYCGASERLEVATVCIHRGEEPPLNPIVNIFFPHCNLHCIYCQNHQISGSAPHPTEHNYPFTLSDAHFPPSLLDTLVSLLTSPDSQSSLLGLVTATHYAPYLPPLLDALHQRGVYPTVVYNSSGYESVDTLRTLEGLVDIYLPDYKYADPRLADAYSHAPNYPQVALEALHEMRRQVGIGLKTDDGRAYRGLLVRHLVLPGHVDNSLAVLDTLASFNFPLPSLSLMAQYYPPRPDLPAPLDRTLTADEYDTVVRHAQELGFTDIWTQELTAQSNYRPDFTNANPFK